MKKIKKIKKKLVTAKSPETVHKPVIVCQKSDNPWQESPNHFHFIGAALHNNP